MKELLIMLIKLRSYPRQLRFRLRRHLLQRLFPYQDRLRAGVISRPAYGYCIFQAANLASLLNYPRISVIEFGCGGGNGLVDAEMHIAEVEKIFGVTIELYGFDMGSGLPSPQDYRDIPHYFQPGLYKMDHAPLTQKLKRAKLVIGNVEETCTNFFNEYDPAPIGCVFHDLDFYSSTKDALKIFDTGSQHFLPRVFMYFDDIIGDDIWLCNEFTGERLAIDEFNKSHEKQKIARTYHVQFDYPYDRWTHQIFIYHDFHHPKYNEFVAQAQQKGLQQFITLRQEGRRHRRPQRAASGSKPSSISRHQ